MKKSLKRTLSLVLAVILLMGVLGTSAFANTANYEYYTVLGDSNASGYGMDAYFANAELYGEHVKEGCLIPGTYPAIIAEALGIETVDVQSHCAWRTNEFLHMLSFDNDIVPWDSFFLRALDFVNRNTVGRDKSEAIINAIKKADLISIDFGSNDIYSFSIYETYNTYAVELEKLLDDLNDLGKVFDDPQTALAALFDAADKAGLLIPIINEFKKNLDENTAEFENNIAIVVEKVRELNPDAKMIMMGVFCPISFDMRVNGDVVLDFKSSSDKRIAGINNYLKNECRCKDEYTFIDASKPECYGIGALDFQLLLALSEDVKYSAVKMVHPNEAGHKYLAESILSTLKTESYIPVVAPRYSTYIKTNTLNWNTVDGAVKYKVYRSTSLDGNYTLMGTSTKDIFYDYLTFPGITYYYKVCAVMDKYGSICSDFSDPVSIKAKF